MVAKVKTIPGHKWHSQEKHWSLPNSNGTLEKILKAFKGEEIHLDPALRVSKSVIARPHNPTISSLVKHTPPNLPLGKARPQNPPFSKGGEGGFEDLRRELLSRKYSYRTVKGYLYYNRDFLNFLGKIPSEINDNDIKDYLLYLAERKTVCDLYIESGYQCLEILLWHDA